METRENDDNGMRDNNLLQPTHSKTCVMPKAVGYSTASNCLSYDNFFPKNFKHDMRPLNTDNLTCYLFLYYLVKHSTSLTNAPFNLFRNCVKTKDETPRKRCQIRKYYTCLTRSHIYFLKSLVFALAERSQTKIQQRTKYDTLRYAMCYQRTCL